MSRQRDLLGRNDGTWPHVKRHKPREPPTRSDPPALYGAWSVGFRGRGGPPVVVVCHKSGVWFGWSSAAVSLLAACRFGLRFDVVAVVADAVEVAAGVGAAFGAGGDVVDGCG